MSTFASVMVIFLLLLGSIFSVIGSLGLLRLSNFYQRMHASAVISSLSTLCIVISCIIFFSTEGWVVPHILILMFVTVTASANAAILTRTAIYRDRRSRKKTLQVAVDDSKPIFTGQREE